MPLTIDHLTFGVELEVFLPRNRTRAALAEHLVAGGVACSTESYNHQLRRHWKIVDDGSLNDYARGCELVSPVFTANAADFEACRRAVRLIDEFGCTVRRACGFHVHVGTRNLNVPVGFYKQLIRTYAKYEPILDGLVAPSRRANNQAFAVGVIWHPDIDAARDLDGVRSAYHRHRPGNTYGEARYRKLNLEAYLRHGTVEFRQHQGTTNPQKVENWVRLCCRMVAYAQTVATARSAASESAASESASAAPTTVHASDEHLLYQLPTVSHQQLVQTNHDYFYSWVITWLTPNNPRRAGTAGHANLQHYAVGRTIAEYRRAGGLLTHLRWDVEHGYARVGMFDYSRPIPWPILAAANPRTRLSLRTHLDLRLRAEARAASPGFLGAVVSPPHQAAATRASAVTTGATGSVDPTAAVTLDGLAELLELTDTERAFFEERYLELNA